MPNANPFAAGAQAALLPFSQMQRAWLDMSTKLTGGTTDTYVTAFERTYGALSDALGLGPMRKLQAALGQLMSAAAAQNDARARYAMLVQSAFSSGFDEMMRRLADMAQIITETRRRAREDHGWIMDTYLIRRPAADTGEDAP